MALIPCTTGTLALYAQEDGSTLAVPVEAWSDTDPWSAFVATSDGHLVAANGRAGFRGLEQAAVVVPERSEPRKPRTVRAPQPGRRPLREGPRERPGV